MIVSLALIVLASMPRGDDAKPGREVRVSTIAELRAAIAEAKPGGAILIAPGEYPGGLSIRELKGEADRPIRLKGEDPAHPPRFTGGSFAMQLSQVSYVELHDLTVVGASDNGINIDDGGILDKPSHHLLLRGLTVQDIGPRGNHDGIKLSGIADFRVEDCTLIRWGEGGSGIDMVGCRRGEIVGSLFQHGDQKGSNSVQSKGGSEEITVRRCRFEHAGERAVNLGGSTGLAFFRPRPQGFEARKITVEDCTFIGSMAPFAFVGVDGATVRFNTIYRPARWIMRILQENREPGFVSSRNGVFENNLIAFRSDELAVPMNVGDATSPETFRFARNAWFCIDNPSRSRPELPVAEVESVYGEDPQFEDAEAGKLTLKPTSPVSFAGVRPR